MSLVIGGLIAGGIAVAYKLLRGSRKTSNYNSEPSVKKEKVVEQTEEITKAENKNNSSPLKP